MARRVNANGNPASSRTGSAKGSKVRNGTEPAQNAGGQGREHGEQEEREVRPGRGRSVVSPSGQRLRATSCPRSRELRNGVKPRARSRGSRIVERPRRAPRQLAAEDEGMPARGSLAHGEDVLHVAAEEILVRSGTPRSSAGPPGRRASAASEGPEAHVGHATTGPATRPRARAPRQPRLEVHDAQHRLQRGGQHRLLGAPARLSRSPAAEPQQCAQRRGLGPARERAPETSSARRVGQHAHRRRRARAPEVLRDHEPRTASPRKASASLSARRGARWHRSGGVRARSEEQRRRAKACPRRAERARRAHGERIALAGRYLRKASWRWCRRSRRRWSGPPRRPACAPGSARSRGRSRGRASRS